MPDSSTGPDPRGGRAAPTRRRRRTAAAVGLALSASVLAACGGDEGGPQTLTWYINPDSGGQAEIASRCTDAAGGAYRIETAVLPREAAAQREQLVRRLAANDDSIDLMSLDPPFIPEFAEANFLAEIPEDVAERVTEGVLDSAIVGSTWKEELVAVPFWANTQLLWYRKSVAEAAGLDMTQPVTWAQVVEAAQSQDKLVGAQGVRAEALTVWINALVESAGGSIITDTAAQPEDIELGLTDEPARLAAEVMRLVATSGVGGPAFSTQNEDNAATGFEGDDAGFMVNYPFVWPRAVGAAEAGTLDASVPADFGWAVYPRVVEDQDAAPPYGGINLGVGAFSQAPELAFEAAECITSEENQAYYFVSNGNPASKASVYDDPEVLAAFPQAPVIRESLELAAPRPQTAYYNEVSQSLQRVYHPPSSVQPGETGERAAKLIKAVLRKEQLL
ncbi:MAG: extracellular solute-binding protein [Frankiaceae bacterium]|nr:extracellular solute-binding protein [Frankiaceae bacterium]